jgi:hypothetical protein
VDHWQRKKNPQWRRNVPWAFVAPHEEQALRNHDQTLRRLAERGGLGPAEMLLVLQGKELQDLTTEELAMPQVEALLAAWNRRATREDGAP